MRALFSIVSAGFTLGILVTSSVLSQVSDIRNENREVIPDIRKCAKKNFPAKAKPYVKKAMVDVQILVDTTGMVREAEPLEIKLIESDNSENAQATMPSFARAGQDSLLNQKCPIFYRNGKAVPYRLVVPLLYEVR